VESGKKKLNMNFEKNTVEYAISINIVIHCRENFIDETEFGVV